MKYKIRCQLAGVLLTCSLLEACANALPDDGSATQTPDRRDVAQTVTMVPTPALPTITPLDYYQWTQAATLEELAAERLRLDARWGASDPLINTVHLAILLSLSNLASHESEAEATALLATIGDPARVDENRRAYAIFADFLRKHLEQRASLRHASSSVVASREKLETLERNNQQLQDKIQALTSIEEQLIEREQTQNQQSQNQQTQEQQAQGQTTQGAN